MSARWRAHEHWRQCDQIWRFIGLWPTFKCFWQHLICPNISHSSGIFVNVSKSIISLVKSFWAISLDIWQFFWSHCLAISRLQQERIITIIVVEYWVSHMVQERRVKGSNASHRECSTCRELGIGPELPT